jgi:hypothetical protein
MRITFDLPDPAAALLLRLMGHIREHACVEPDAAAICQSMIVDLLIDDAMAHGIIAGDRVRLQ